MTAGLASSRVAWFGRVLPGVVLCLSVALLSDRLASSVRTLTGRIVIDPVVLAILLGMFIRCVWRPSSTWGQGITCCAKFLLECSVAMLGASIDATIFSRLGPPLILSVCAVVAAAVAASYAFSRACGLPPRLSLLVACGNSICGNAAIGAVAPLIGADARDITAAVSYTALIGLVIVLGLPLLIPVLHLTPAQYGELAGLTVYSVPQVLAATLPVSVLSSQIGTIIKLLRVLMLGPVVLTIAYVVAGPRRRSRQPAPGHSVSRVPTSMSTLVPWFLLGFAIFAIARSLNALPFIFLGPIASTAHVLTVISMAALGLAVDLRTIIQFGNRVALAVAGSLTGLFAIALAIVRILPVS